MHLLIYCFCLFRVPIFKNKINLISNWITPEPTLASIDFLQLILVKSDSYSSRIVFLSTINIDKFRLGDGVEFKKWTMEAALTSRGGRNGSNIGPLRYRLLEQRDEAEMQHLYSDDEDDDLDLNVRIV